MAAECTVSGFVVNFTRGVPPNDARVSVNPDQITLDVPSNKYIKSTQEVGVADETLDLGSVVDPGLVFIRNMDAANFVEVGDAAADYPLVVEAGEWQWFRWNSAAIHVKADSAPVDIEYLILSRSA